MSLMRDMTPEEVNIEAMTPEEVTALRKRVRRTLVMGQAGEDQLFRLLDDYGAEIEALAKRGFKRAAEEAAAGLGLAPAAGRKRLTRIAQLLALYLRTKHVMRV